jgi:hypothetical protein
MSTACEDPARGGEGVAPIVSRCMSLVYLSGYWLGLSGRAVRPFLYHTLHIETLVTCQGGTLTMAVRRRAVVAVAFLAAALAVVQAGPPPACASAIASAYYDVPQRTDCPDRFGHRHLHRVYRGTGYTIIAASTPRLLLHKQGPGLAFNSMCLTCSGPGVSNLDVAPCIRRDTYMRRICA